MCDCKIVDDKFEICIECQTKARINTLRIKAKEKVLLDILVSEYRSLIESKQDLDCEILKEARRSFQNHSKLRKQKVSSEYYWVSVNPSNEHSISDLQVKVEKYVNRRFIVGSMYTYEWCRNGTPHAHMLIHQLELSDTDFRKNTKNTFKNLVGNLACIDIKRVPTDWVQDKMDYIKGVKWDPEKDDLIDIDKKLRIEYGLESYYSTGTLKKGSDNLLDEDPV